uniref:Uncharacterized protein n=1 Tax=Avena sativa TaxID=4498 RepID=A0ACD5WXA2_AVESA
MVFPPAPAYLDPPNWNNQQGQQPRATGGGGVGGGDAQQEHMPVGPTTGTASQPEAVGLPSSSLAANEAAGGQPARPNSMTERARVARVPQPEPALKCPRCDSTNTKFCYYNNYSLSQPRHFCKACRRYWTRGCALRTVPVGGGCRRNKRSSKSSAASSSKPSSSSARQLAGGASSMPSTAASTNPGPTAAMMPSGLSSMSHHLPFLGTMHPQGPNLGLAFSVGLPPLGMQQRQHMDGGGVDQFPLASGGGSTFGGSLEQWRVQQQQPHQQQFPFLELPPTPPMYQLGLQANRAGSSAAAPSPAMFTLGQTSATTARHDEGTMKQDDSKGQEMSLQRQYMLEALRQGEGVWGGSASDNSGNGSGSWTMNLPGFHSSSGGGGDGGGLL